MTRMHIEDLVAVFNEEITNYRSDKANWSKSDLIKLRVRQLQEEVQETQEAIDSGDFVGAVDGLIDGIYFALGTLHIMGVDRELMNACFTAVHLANMSKKPGIKDSRRLEDVADEDHPMDAIKPEGWISPEYLLRKILDE